MSLVFWCVMANNMGYLVVHRRKTSCPVRRREKKDNGDQVPNHLPQLADWISLLGYIQCNIIISSAKLKDLLTATAWASQRSGFEPSFRPKFFRPFSLMLKQP